MREEGIAIANGKAAPRRRRPRIHDQRARATKGLRLGANALELDEFSVEIKILGVRPDQLDRVEPLLAVFVARLMLALRDAEHLEFIFVPAHDEIEPKASGP